MKGCFLRGHGPCSRKISREHYISASVLEAMTTTGSVDAGGFRWQPSSEFQSIGIGSLQGKILCQDHNNALSGLDNLAGHLFRNLDAADKNWVALPAHSAVDGPSFERWLLKVLCGLAAAAGFNNGIVPDVWKALLLGGPWPEWWGTYFPQPAEVSVLATEFFVETRVNPATKDVLAADFRIAGVTVSLLLGRPNIPEAFGTYRPRALIFRHGADEKRIEFIWPFETERAVILTKVGANNLYPPQWLGWQKHEPR